MRIEVGLQDREAPVGEGVATLPDREGGLPTEMDTGHPNGHTGTHNSNQKLFISDVLFDLLARHHRRGGRKDPKVVTRQEANRRCEIPWELNLKIPF